MPTILELAKVDYPAEFRGRKIEPMRVVARWLACWTAARKPSTTTTEFGRRRDGRNGKWMRQGDFKAVMVPAPYGTGEWQLFNVAEDPGEAKDLSNTMPDKLEILKTEWDRYATEVGVVPSEQ